MGRRICQDLDLLATKKQLIPPKKTLQFTSIKSASYIAIKVEVETKSQNLVKKYTSVRIYLVVNVTTIVIAIVQSFINYSLNILINAKLIKNILHIRIHVYVVSYHIFVY